jgi:SAM-dependent methyltransferase
MAQEILFNRQRFAQRQSKGVKYLGYSAADAEAYDRDVRTLVPGYRSMIHSIADHLAARNEAGRVIDLGAGTGNLVHSLVSVLPNASFCLVDFSAAMCASAETKLSGQIRCSIVNRDISDFRDSDAHSVVISTLLLHEYCDDRRLRLNLIESMFHSLEHGGELVIADYYAPAAEEQRSDWITAIQSYARGVGANEPDLKREVEEHLFDKAMPTLADEFASVRSSLGVEPAVLTSTANLFTWSIRR